MPCYGGDIPAAALARAQTSQPAVWVYKKAGLCEIKADVFVVPGPGPHPVAVWIHGGARIAGSRKLASGAPVLPTLREAGFAVISIDYRLAPETTLPGSMKDVENAFAWLRSHAGGLHADPALGRRRRFRGRPSHPRGRHPHPAPSQGSGLLLGLWRDRQRLVRQT